MRVQPLCWEDPVENEMATHSNILAWEIPWTEEPCGLKKESDLTEQLNNSGKIQVLLKYLRQLILYNYIFIMISFIYSCVLIFLYAYIDAVFAQYPWRSVFHG